MCCSTKLGLAKLFHKCINTIKFPLQNFGLDQIWRKGCNTNKMIFFMLWVCLRRNLIYMSEIMWTCEWVVMKMEIHGFKRHLEGKIDSFKLLSIHKSVRVLMEELHNIVYTLWSKSLWEYRFSGTFFLVIYMEWRTLNV